MGLGDPTAGAESDGGSSTVELTEDEVTDTIEACEDVKTKQL